MKINVIDKRVEAIDTWLANHKKILFLSSIALVFGLDLFNWLPIYIIFNNGWNYFFDTIKIKELNYPIFLHWILSINLLALLFILCYFFRITIKNILIYTLTVIFLLHLYYFATVNFHSLRLWDYPLQSHILAILTLLRVLVNFTIAFVFFVKSRPKARWENRLYLVFFCVYYPVYIVLGWPIIVYFLVT